MRPKCKKMTERERPTSFKPEEEILSGIKRNGGWVNAHAHLDRAFSLTPQSYDLSRKALQEKWQIVDDLKRNSTIGQIYGRMAQAVELMLGQGVQAVGTFIDVDDVIEDKSMEAADRVRSEYRSDMRFVFINQVLKGVLDPDAQRWFLEGSQFVDVIGGLPKKDQGREKDHIDTILQTAKSMGKMIHAHVDQLNTPSETETELLADRTIALGMQGRVVAVHGISIAANPKEYRRAVYKKMREAGIMLISCPTAWIDSRRTEDLSVTHNSIAPVEEVLEEGIPVAIGTDNIYDVFKPFSDGDMWSELRLLLETCGLRDKDDLIRIATTNGLMVLGLKEPSWSENGHKPGS